MKTLLAIFILSVACVAQCNLQNSQTVCQGPVIVVAPPQNTLQSGVILVDLGLPTPAPGSKQYILSIGGGTIQESDNGGPYHSLIGPPGPPGAAGAPGAAATVTMGQTFTSAPGSPATVTNSGTPNAAVLNFTIPQGMPGVIVGVTLTGTLSCPPNKSKGTVGAGFTTANCTLLITKIH